MSSKYLTSLIVATFLSYGLGAGQSFVNLSNEWYITDCCTSFSDGQTYCWTFRYYFEDSVMVDSVQYLVLATDSDEGSNYVGRLYRESDGKVFMKYSAGGEEILIYDFTVYFADFVEIGNGSNPLVLEVVDVDSIVLNSGVKRKRLKLKDVSHPIMTTYWIEGVGSTLSPLNTLGMFSFDCWNELDCFWSDSMAEYTLGDCEVSSAVLNMENRFELTLAPNPVRSYLAIGSKEQVITQVEVIDASGKVVLREAGPVVHGVNIGALPDGVYFLRATSDSGRIALSSIVKVE